MNGEIFMFFDKRQAALPIYEALERCILENVENVRIKVQKTQISFYNEHLFAAVSFLRLRKKADMPENYVVLTLGLDHPLADARIVAATEPYPGRFTHHIIISDAREVDGELTGWITEAAAFAAAKRQERSK